MMSLLRNVAPRHRAMLAVGASSLLLIAATLVPVPVGAVDAKAARGTQCNGRTKLDRDRSYRYPSGALEAALGDINITCSLERDIVSGRLDDVALGVFKAQSAAPDMECWVYSRSSRGSFQDKEKQTVSSQGNASVDFALSSFSEISHGYYYVYCKLQQGDFIDYLSWTES